MNEAEGQILRNGEAVSHVVKRHLRDGNAQELWWLFVNEPLPPRMMAVALQAILIRHPKNVREVLRAFQCAADLDLHVPGPRFGTSLLYKACRSLLDWKIGFGHDAYYVNHLIIELVDAGDQDGGYAIE